MPCGWGSQYLPHYLLTSKTSEIPNFLSWHNSLMSLIRPALDARDVAPSAVSSQSLATHTLKKRLTIDEMMKGIAFDAGKAIPVSYLLALFQSLVPYPKPANSDPPPPPPPEQQLPQPGVPSPQNPTGGYYPGAPINQESPGQVSPQSYYDPRTNSQVSYQDPRLQDPRYVAAIQQQAQQIASAGGQQYPQDQPAQGFSSTQADFSQMIPQGQ